MLLSRETPRKVGSLVAYVGPVAVFATLHGAKAFIAAQPNPHYYDSTRFRVSSQDAVQPYTESRPAYTQAISRAR
jgi:hypothetical protein